MARQAINWEEREQWPYRQGAIGVVLHGHGEILLVQMRDYGENEWRFPGGGIDDAESAEVALLRELREELGTAAFGVVDTSERTIMYDWNEQVIEARYKKEGVLYRGQSQSQFLIKYMDESYELDIDRNELKAYLWITPEKYETYLIFPNQAEEARMVLEEFGIL